MSKMDLNKLRDEVHANAVAKGFWDEQLSDEHYLMLVITELSEAVEADRKGRRAKSEEFKTTIHKLKQSGAGLTEQSYEHWYEHWFSVYFVEYIKDTVEDELCDAVIRLLDLAGAKNVNLESANHWISLYGTQTNRSFTEDVFSIATDIYKNSLSMSIARIFKLANHININLEWHIEQKMKYNQNRERMHGKKY